MYTYTVYTISRCNDDLARVQTCTTAKVAIETEQGEGAGERRAEQPKHSINARVVANLLHASLALMPAAVKMTKPGK